MPYAARLPSPPARSGVPAPPRGACATTRRAAWVSGVNSVSTDGGASISYRLISMVGHELQERLDGALWRTVVGDSRRGEDLARGRHRLPPEPAAQYRRIDAPATGARPGDLLARHHRRLARARTEPRRSSRPRCALERLDVALRRRVADDVHGFACDQVVGENTVEPSIVISDSREPPSARAAPSAAITPAPPPLVTIMRRSPRNSAPRARVSAAPNNSRRVSTRSIPARRIAASKTSSAPASAPVCEAPPWPPRRARPAFTTMTGLLRAAARAADMNLRAVLIDSM